MSRQLALVGVAISLVLAVATPAQAQGRPTQTNVVPGERLSDWLLRQVGPDGDTSALHWRVPAERNAQDWHTS